MSQLKILLQKPPKPVEPIAISKLLFRPRNTSSPNQSRRLMSNGLVAHYPLHAEADLVIQEYISEILQLHQSQLGKGDDQFAIAVYWGNPMRLEVKSLERLRRLQESNWRVDFWKELGDRAEVYDPTKYINLGYISGDGLSIFKLHAIVEV